MHFCLILILLMEEFYQAALQVQVCLRVPIKAGEYKCACIHMYFFIKWLLQSPPLKYT